MVLLPWELHMTDVSTHAMMEEYIANAPVQQVEAPPITVDTEHVWERVTPMVSTDEWQPGEYEQEESLRLSTNLLQKEDTTNHLIVTTSISGRSSSRFQIILQTEILLHNG